MKRMKLLDPVAGSFKRLLIPHGRGFPLVKPSSPFTGGDLGWAYERSLKQSQKHQNHTKRRPMLQAETIGLSLVFF